MPLRLHGDSVAGGNPMALLPGLIINRSLHGVYPATLLFGTRGGPATSVSLNLHSSQNDELWKQIKEPGEISTWSNTLEGLWKRVKDRSSGISDDRVMI